MPRTFALIGALSAALAVAAGAFGAHALRARLEPRMLEAFETGARYQMYHALALFAVAWIITRTVESGVVPGTALGTVAGTVAGASGAGLPFALVAGWSFVAGTVLFSGSLYALALTGVRSLGAITPIGGVCFIVGWICLAVAAARSA
jgi:uncharacterized membrane protein YgdD (TMEM256/DUF423 family)